MRPNVDPLPGDADIRQLVDEHGPQWALDGLRHSLAEAIDHAQSVWAQMRALADALNEEEPRDA